MSEHFTITLNHGGLKAIMIQQAENEHQAYNEFVEVFGAFYRDLCHLTEGIHIENGFQDLITEGARKLLLKVKNGSPDAPKVFSYLNSMVVQYE